MADVATAADLNRPLTYEDYLSIPDDGKRWEILDGRPYVSPAPGSRHQRLSFRLQQALAGYFEARGGEVLAAPFDVLLGKNDVCQPDLIVVTDAKRLGRANLVGAPDVVIEILSPSTSLYDRNTKAARYLLHGVRHYWLFDPEARSVELRRSAGGSWEPITLEPTSGWVTHPDLPGLAVELAALWREPF